MASHLQPPSGAKINREHSLYLEEHTIKTPYELLRRNFRSAQRAIEKDFLALNALVQEVQRLEAGGDETGEARRERLGTGEERVRGLKRKLVDLLPSTSHPPVLRARLDHLSRLETFEHTTDPGFAGWSEKRFYRILVDYLARTGRPETARMLARSAHIEFLVDVDLFEELARIERALDDGVCTEALAWCGENRGTLKKNADSLEFALRLQEYIELCRQRSTAAALTYLRKHLAPWSDSHLAEIRKAMGLLACDEPTARRVPAYAALYSRHRTGALRQRFRTTFLGLYSLPAQPTLNTALAVGLSAFKLPFCAPAALPPLIATDASSNAEAGPSSAGPIVRLPSSPIAAPPSFAAHHQHERSCPTCDINLHALARGLPASHHMTSVVVCRLSGRVMDDSEEGRPMCFPNGYVYSYGALRDMADENDGLVCCPRSGLECDFTELRRVYIS